jgi:integrase
MRKFHAENEIMKRRYVQHVRNVKGLGNAAIDSLVAAIDRYQDHTGARPFKKFHIEQAVAFRRALDKQKNPKTGQPLSASTLRSVLNALKGFFHWLADQRGYKSRISHSDAEYFNLDNRSAALANVHRPVKFPSVQQIDHVLRQVPDGKPMERRDRAIVALATLTGARISALNSARVGDIDIVDHQFHQDARYIDTKFSKTINTWFFPVSDLALEILVDYHKWLTTELLFGPSDPLFPATEVIHVPGKGFQGMVLSRRFRNTTGPVRDVFRKAFMAAGLPYYHPHAFRHTLGAIGKERCKSPQALQAWAQNLGHEDAATLMQNYGKVTPEQQRDLIRSSVQ